MRALSLHTTVLAGHILFAAITIGATVAYATWIAVAERQPDHLAFTIRAVRRSDRVLAIPAFVLTFVTGVWLVDLSGVRFETRWLTASVALYAVILLVGFGVFGPVVRRELDALERGGVTDGEYLRLRVRARILSFGTIVALAFILWLMVARPG
jgi:uncharacterized membrane protein